MHRAATLRAEQAGGTGPSQEDVDYAVVLALSAAYGYGLGKLPLFRALGRKPQPGTDDAVMQRLSDMVQTLIAPRP